MQKTEIYKILHRLLEVKLNHPVHGDLETSILINPHSIKRSEVESLIIGSKFSQVKESIVANSAIAASVIDSWDDEFIGCEFTFDNALSVLAITENSFITHQILNVMLEYDREYNDALQECLDEIKKFMDGNKKVGSSTKSVLYKKLERDYDKLPDNLKKSFDEMKMDNEHLSRDEVFKPKQIISLAYSSFFALRNTKSVESYILHSDVVSYMQLTGKKLTPYDVDSILSMDRMFLQSYHESNKNTK